jgi:hypothetical protein
MLSQNQAGYQDGQKKDSVIRVWKGKDVILSRLKIQNGSALCGGGIYNEGDLIINNCDIFKNQATYGGGVYNFTTSCNIFNYNNTAGADRYSSDIVTLWYSAFSRRKTIQRSLA